MELISLCNHGFLELIIILRLKFVEKHLKFKVLQTIIYFSNYHGWLIVGHFACIVKRPTRDTCLYLGEKGERVGPPVLPAPAFSQQPLGGFSSNLAYVCSSPGKIFGIWYRDLSTNQRSHMTKKVCFSKG